MGRAVLALLVAVVMAAVAAAGCGGGTPGCTCGDGGARLECRGAGLRHLPPLHDHLLYL